MELLACLLWDFFISTNLFQVQGQEQWVIWKSKPLKSDTYSLNFEKKVFHFLTLIN